MDKATARYIRNYFPHLMTADEKLALKHHMYTYQASDYQKMKNQLTEQGLTETEPEVLKFLGDSYEQFELDVAKRIMAETPEEIFFNNCGKCNKLARTPKAKQCRFCGHSWHNCY